MVLEVQVVGIVFCLVMLYFTYLFYKRKNYSWLSLVFWAGVWIIGGFLMAFPGALASVTHELAFARIFDLYLTIAIMFFSIITFFNHVRVSKYERKVEDLVRVLAIREPKSEGKLRRKR